jgi:hypothetical protein
VEELVELVQALLGESPRRARFTLSIATFIPKAFTPFQWEAFAVDDDLRPRREYVLRHLPRRRVKVNFHSYALSRLEAVFARGDRKLADVIEHAFHAGCRFDDWRERLDYAAWERAFAACGIDPDDYLAEIPVDAPLPWSVLDCGVTTEFLQRERRRAYAETPTPSCRDGVCRHCGVQRWFPCDAGPATGGSGM